MTTQLLTAAQVTRVRILPVPHPHAASQARQARCSDQHSSVAVGSMRGKMLWPDATGKNVTSKNSFLEKQPFSQGLLELRDCSQLPDTGPLPTDLCVRQLLARSPRSCHPHTPQASALRQAGTRLLASSGCACVSTSPTARRCFTWSGS